MMKDKDEEKIVVDENEKFFAIYSFHHSMANARIKRVFKRSLQRARKRIAARNAAKAGK